MKVYKIQSNSERHQDVSVVAAENLKSALKFYVEWAEKFSNQFGEGLTSIEEIHGLEYTGNEGFIAELV